jgi:hypothetical protein
MPDGARGELVWYRARCDSGACLEVAATGDTVIVRSSAKRGEPPVQLSRAEWQAFVSGVKEGAFDGV